MTSVLQECTDMGTVATMTETIRVPMAVAARRGVSWLPEQAASKRVILTSHGRPVAIVDTAERYDEDVRKIREAAWAVLDSIGEKVAQRTASFSTDELCARLGVDPAAVRARAAQKAEEYDLDLTDPPHAER